MNDVEKVERRNGSAVMATLNAQNDKLAEMETKIVTLAKQVHSLNEELTALRKQNMDELVAKFSNGPTT